MAEIQRTQTYRMAVGRCFESLLRVWHVMEIQMKKSDPETYTAEGHWSLGWGAKMIFRAECRDNSDGSTQLTPRNDMHWTPILSRPSRAGEKAARAFEGRILAKMERVLEALGNYLQDENSLPKLTPGLGLDLDHPAWIVGGIISVGGRWLTGLAGPGWLPAIANGTDGQVTYLHIMGVTMVIVGAAVTGFVIRRNPLKGSAFFEGMIVALVNV